jgi:hypothetical protein
MIVKILFKSAGDHSRVGKLTHVLRRVYEKDVVVLQNEVMRLGIHPRGKKLLARNAEKLDADSHRCLEVGPAGNRIAGEADPGVESLVLKYANT